MMVARPAQISVVLVLMIMALLGAPEALHAQANVGTGPLTGTLAETEPTSGVLSLGRIKVAPGLIIREIGWDSNVFDEPDAESPKEDYVASFQPDASIFTRLRLFKISAYAGSELTYYKKYASEQSVGHALRGRVDILLSRFRPFIGGGQTKSRTRPNGEIDVRANRKEEELSGGLSFDLGAHSLVYVSAVQTYNGFESAVQSGVDLGESLTRDSYLYQGGVRTDLTPLLTFTLSGGLREDRFRADPTRDSDSLTASAQFGFAPQAVVSGGATFSYRKMKPVDPLVTPFEGILGSVTLTYPFLEIGRFNFSLTRNIEYSFDSVEAYFLENTANIAYTHHLFGVVDAQVRAGRSYFDYSARPTSAARTDTLDTVAGSLGYNLRNRTRVAVNYEYSRRRSELLAERNYQRRRAYLSWLFAF